MKHLIGVSQRGNQARLNLNNPEVCNIKEGEGIEIFSSMFNSILSRVERNNPNENTSCYFKPIPLSTYTAITNIQKLLLAYEDLIGNKPPSFLDCGCGGGNVINMFNHIYYRRGLSKRLGHCKMSGIEIRKDVANVARYLCNYFNTEIINGDIILYGDYAKHNLIYYYHPLKNRFLEILFEERLEDEVSVGTIICPVLKSSRSYLDDERFKVFYIGETVLLLKVTNGNRERSDLVHYNVMDLIPAQRRRYSKSIKKYSTFIRKRKVLRCGKR